MTNAEFRYWKDSGHILIEADNWSCFLNNATLNPLINWLNLHREDIVNGSHCTGKNKVDGVYYSSSKGFVFIATFRDFVFLNKEQTKEFIVWLKKHKDILNIREVWP